MLRFVLIAAALSACDYDTRTPGHPDPGPLPDAYIGCVGAFHVVAPVADLHYDKSLDVYVDESEEQGELTLTMTDDLGTTYSESFHEYGPDPDGMYWSRDRFHYELAGNHRYELRVSNCYDTETITFFTSP